MNPIHVALHVWPVGLPQKIFKNAHGVACIESSRVHFDRPFPNAFDDVLTAMDQSLDAYVEGDGSFVFTGQHSDGRVWKTNGTLYEADDQIINVEIWIERTPVAKLERLIELLGVTPEDCIYQSLTEGIFQTHEQFCNRVEIG